MTKYPRLSVEDSIDMEAQCLYRYIKGDNDGFHPHCHDFYEIFITAEGTVTHFINGVETKLPEGSLVFIRPDDVHGYMYESAESMKTSFINLTFTYETAELLFEYLSSSFPSDRLLFCKMPPTVTLNKWEKKHLITQISELNSVNWTDKNALKLRMRVILADIFVRHFYNMPENSESSSPQWLAQLLSLMERYENFTVGIDRMIELSKRSREHLSRSMKKYYGVTLTEYINDLRINYAVTLLIKSDTPILEICFECGFQSISSFYKVFGSKYGISPKEFRKRYKK